jgi:hypothetical protein
MMVLWSGTFLEIRIIRIPEVFIRGSLIKEGNNEPYKKQQWYYDGHDHIPDLITKVHENRYNVISLC